MDDIQVGGRNPALPPRTARRIIREVLAGERSDARVSLTFVGPRMMRRLNHAHKGDDRITDVLAFALPQPDGSVAGDIYVCRAAAMGNARRHGVQLREELVRLVIHGTLHLLGWDHPEGPGRTRSAMWKRQERYVERFA